VLFLHPANRDTYILLIAVVFPSRPSKQKRNACLGLVATPINTNHGRGSVLAIAPRDRISGNRAAVL